MKYPKCDAPNPDTQRFCGECGTALMASPGPGRPEVEDAQKRILELTK